MTEETIDQRSRADLKAHTDVCTERYSNLWEAVKRLEKNMVEANTQAHGRFNTISNRMWTIVVSSLGATVVGLACIVFWLITHKAGA